MRRSISTSTENSLQTKQIIKSIYIHYNWVNWVEHHCDLENTVQENEQKLTEKLYRATIIDEQIIKESGQKKYTHEITTDKQIQCIHNQTEINEHGMKSERMLT